ncbi:MAG: serine/threonine-protein kinase [Deltaproteobacteria bacterium]
MVLRSRTRPRTYLLEQRLAAGGMGEVYTAVTPDLNRRVAVKRMLDADASDEDLKLLFLREVAVAATLEHHNVVEVLDAGQNGHELFLVMEYVDGPSLAEIAEVLRRQGKILPIEVSCGIVSQIARGLGHAHTRAMPDGTPLGIVHRDVAPENVLIGTDGIPKIVDFGLAKLSGHSLTQPGVIRGRPRSLSPEQARGDPVDARADIFSLGALLFELTSGQPLYAGDQVATLLWKVAAGDYDPLEPRLTHVDADLTAIIQRAVAVDADDRFRSAREMERALDAFRAARGMRMSARALAQVVTITWPAIQKMRQERLDGTAGELEGSNLVLPADRLDAGDTLDGTKSGDVSGGFSVPAQVQSPAIPAPPVAAPPSPLTQPVATRTSDAYPRPNLAPAAWTELPRPSAPAFTQNLERPAGAVWLAYIAAVLIAAAAAFGFVWTSDDASPTPHAERTSNPSN